MNSSASSQNTYKKIMAMPLGTGFELEDFQGIRVRVDISDTFGQSHPAVLALTTMKVFDAEIYKASPWKILRVLEERYE